MVKQRLLTTCNRCMVIFFLAFIASAIVAWGYEQYLSVMLLALFHVLQIIFAALFKLAYVFRLVAQHQLGLTLR